MILLLYPKLYFFYYSKNSMAKEKDLLSRLMADAQSGASDSYRILLNQISLTLTKYLARRVGSIDDREDVLQEILLGIHNSRHTYLPSRPFYPWMFAVARNILIKYYRNTHKQNANLVEMEMQSIASPEKSEAEITETLTEITHLIQELPGNQRKIISMLKIQGFSIKEVAAKLGLSDANVKVIAHRGYQKLRKQAKN
jgi:RNA polymerase sigma-70 factor (ECF subfamily)